MLNSTSAVLHNVLSVLDLAGHCDVMPAAAVGRQSRGLCSSCHDVSSIVNNGSSTGSGVTITRSGVTITRSSGAQTRLSRYEGTMRDFADLLHNLPSTIRKKTLKANPRSNSGTWGRNNNQLGKQRPVSEDFTSRTLPNTKPRRIITPQDISEPISNDAACSMSLTYGKVLKLKKQRAELQRIYDMLDDLENDFLGEKDELGSTYIERYMEVKVEKDYMLSQGNPESALEPEDTVKIFGYLGHNLWRCIGPYCKGFCTASTVINPRIRSQSIVGGIVCTTCNKITVPLIGAVPTSILNLQPSTPD